LCYTSVVERVKEIGTLKAIGASNGQILTLFIIEAILVGIFGASSGLVVGIWMGYILVHAGSGGQSLSPVYLVEDMITVWIISIILSIVAGLYPAWKASWYPPIEALKSNNEAQITISKFYCDVLIIGDPLTLYP
jgi:putative ABC transport system permease protein